MKYRVIKCQYYNEKLVKKDTWYEIQVERPFLFFWTRWCAVTKRGFNYFPDECIDQRFETMAEVDLFLKRCKDIDPCSVVETIHRSHED